MTKILQLKISLEDSKPKIWRRFLVKNNISFYKLHEIIQAVMGWANYHLYTFYVEDEEFGIPDQDFDEEMQNAKKIKLKDKLSEKQRFGYLYDFGDNWEHLVLVEKILDLNPDFSYPTCVDGKMACPPEDVGSFSGYSHMLKALNDKSHPEHEDYKEWIGGKFNPESLDTDEINNALSKLR